jgi:hypothetical protein
MVSRFTREKREMGLNRFLISRMRRYSRSWRSSTPVNQESIIQRLNSGLAVAMAKKVGVPPGLLSCFELEMARLQV